MLKLKNALLALVFALSFAMIFQQPPAHADAGSTWNKPAVQQPAPDNTVLCGTQQMCYR